MFFVTEVSIDYSLFLSGTPPEAQDIHSQTTRGTNLQKPLNYHRELVVTPKVGLTFCNSFQRILTNRYFENLQLEGICVWE